jgi:hypothetical protein
VCWYADPIRKDRGALRASTGDGTAQVPVPPVYRSVLHAVVQWLAHGNSTVSAAREIVLSVPLLCVNRILRRSLLVTSTSPEI